MSPSREQLLEREDELARLAVALAAARAGSGRLLLVEGEAGIGKTSLLDALVEHAEGDGVLVLRARGGELEREFAHGVARQLFERLLRRASADRLERLLRGAAGLAAPVLGLSNQRSAHEGSSGAATLTEVNHGLYWLTAELSDEGALVLVVDDAHWADPETLLFLGHLGGRLSELPVLVVLALRPAESGGRSGPLEAIRGLSVTDGMQPSALSLQAAGELIASLSGSAPPAELRRVCHEMTGGNPFLLAELVRALAAEGRAPDAAAAELVRGMGPEGVARSVLTRLAALGPQALELALAVAVLDTDAELAHAAAIAGLDADVGAQAAASLTDACILAPGALLCFAHPIIRHALYEDLPPGRRAAAHASAARVLDADSADPDRAAVHLLSAEAAGDPWVVQRLRAAAARARSRGAPTAAAALLRRALDEPPPPEQRPATLAELGAACLRAGQPDGVAYLSQALDQWAPDQARVQAAHDLAGGLAVTGEFDRAVSVLDAEIETLGADRREDRLLSEAQALGYAMFSDRLAPRGPERAMRLAAGLTGGTPAERVVLATASYHLGLTRSRTATEVAALAERAAQGLRIVEENTATSQHPYAVYAALVLADRFDRAIELLDALEADARASGSPLGLAMVSYLRARAEVGMGSLAEAEALARSSLPMAPAVSVPYALTALVFALLEQGRADEAHATLEQYGLATGALPPVAPGLVLLRARAAMWRALRRTDLALADAQECVWRETERGFPYAYVGFTNSAALSFAAAGKRTRALEIAGCELEVTRAFGASGTTAGALLVLGLVKGGAEGLALLEQAAAMLATTPLRLDHAHALVELGAALRRSRRRSDAREPLRQGMEIAHKCGARPLAERGRDELLACGARPRKLVLTGIDALTATERRVARLAAEGLTNTEIAQAQFVTRKTVEAQLAAIYRKLDLQSRHELGAALAA